MYATLDLVWKPSAGVATPPAGKAPAIVRNDTYSHTIRVTDGTLNGYDTWDWIAQIRPLRLVAGATVAAALADFTVSLETDGDDLLVHLLLSSTTTTALSLPKAGAFWDLQLADAGVVATWLSGKVKVLDDVSRAA